MKHYIPIFCVLLYLLLCSHTLFEKTIGQPGCYDEGVSVLELDNGNYLVSGAYNCSGSVGDWKGYLVFLNEKGDTLWTKKNLPVNGKIKATLDGNLIFIGGNVGGFVYDTMKIFKTSPTGDIIWKKSIFYSPCKNTVTDILPVQDGFIVTGFYSNTCFNPVYNSFILKINLSGEFEWEYLINGPNNDQIHTVKQMQNGNIAAFGWTDSKTNSGSVDYLLVQLNSTGSLVWSKNYGDELDNYGYGMDITEDNGFIVTGYSHNMEILKIDPDGKLLWSRSYSPACGGKYYQANVSLDGGYTFLGSEYLDNSCKSLLIKTDKDGNTLWKKTFRGKLREFYENSDSSFVLTGYISYLPDIYIIRFDSTKLKVNKIKEITDESITRIRILQRMDSLYLNTTNESLIEPRMFSPKVYPNPADNYATIHFHNPGKDSYDLELFDMNGQRVALQTDSKDDLIFIPRKMLSSGVYIYRLSGADKTYSDKLLFR